ncbi:DUF3999 domain-containing protein [Desulfosudis oleivorans]|uniref:DUF3999 domain-containing protein n=1 Tax=Desulfosudis oleivorans (strain DSM 6200 / JCM 39069 / Hxd3) TaxID=96561 RepID=A8ZZF8_DESOH|nr:DUF3999 domain-containing protein [Desulfosudis oleivorans]ABW67311.1 hypothetical protein Dole_1507 [Desulfosudis oleivorans Hxd3]
MKKWLFMLILVLMLGCRPSPITTGLTENDFAYGMNVEVPKGSAIVALTLPEQVYTHVFRKDLGDLRVFNAAGEPVPHTTRHVKADAGPPAWHPLPFFPLPEVQDTDAATGYSVYVRTGPDGAVVRLDSRADKTDTTQPIREFLIDLSGEKERLAALRLEWPPENGNRIATLTVEAGNDLAHWSTIHSRAAVTDIRYAGHRLRNDEIPLSRYTGRYLRIRQTDTGPTIPVTGIYGRPPVSGPSNARPFLELNIVKPPVEPGVFEYDTEGSYPVDRVNLIFAQTNSMADAVLESRNAPGAAWTRRLTGLFYRIDADGIEVVSAPKSVPVTMDRYWRLTVKDSKSTMGVNAPRLTAGFRSHTLFFIARGSGPFTLAFGSAVARPPEINVAAMFDGIDRADGTGLERWVFPGPMVELGGPQKLVTPPEPLPLRRILLWCLLVGGVLVVAAMAWQLVRGLKAAD